MTGNYEEAIQCQKNASDLALTSNNFEKIKAILKHLLHYKTETLKAEREKRKLEKQRNLIFVISSSIIVVLLILIVFLIRRNLVNQKRVNREISDQKKSIELQKKIVDEKQKEILDSIFYARRIQKALITNETYIAKSLKKLISKK